MHEMVIYKQDKAICRYANVLNVQLTALTDKEWCVVQIVTGPLIDPSHDKLLFKCILPRYTLFFHENHKISIKNHM